jgi:hypothetical protein
MARLASASAQNAVLVVAKWRAQRRKGEGPASFSFNSWTLGLQAFTAEFASRLRGSVRVAY